MRRSLKNKIFFSVLAGFVFFNSLSAQDTLKNDFGLFVNVYTGPVFFPQKKTAEIYPSLIAGATIGLSLFTTELEVGIAYSPFIYDKFTENSTYQKISHITHNVKYTVYAHQKIFQVKKHIISIRAGLDLTYNYALYTDTFMNDGSHRKAYYPNNKYLDRQLGLSVYGGLRYSYCISRKWVIYGEPFFTYKLISEYESVSYGGHGPVYMPKVALTDRMSVGAKFGFVYLISKNIPRFYVKMKKNRK